MTGGTETVEFCAHLDQVRLTVRGDGHLVASVLLDLEEAAGLANELAESMERALDHGEATPS